MGPCREARPQLSVMSPMPKGPALTVDCVCFDGRGRLLLIRRANPPFRGAYALPGGFVEAGETVENACRRELYEETGLEAGELELVGVFSDPARDPRGPTASVVFASLIEGAEPRAGSDAAAAEWVAEWREQDLAFDHAEIAAAAESRLRANLD